MATQQQSVPFAGQESQQLLSELRKRLAEAGCFSRTPHVYAVRIFLITLAYVLGYMGLLLVADGAARIGLLAVIAFATVQAGFIAHDVGDGAVTQNKDMAVLLRHYLMSFLAALSSTYFNHLHRAHHIRLHRGLGAAGHQLANVNPFEVFWLKRLFAWSGIVFAVATICLRGLTFKLESIRYVSQHRKTTQLDMSMMTLHAVVWLVLPIPFIGIASTLGNYFGIVLIGGLYIGTVLVLNHEGMSKVDGLANLSLLERTIVSTRNLGRGWFNDILLGGVNNHVEHHLFPQIPVTSLPKARRIVEAFFAEKGVSYTSITSGKAFVSAVRYFCSLDPDMRVNQALS
jgi:fatty acid desaturase